MIVVLERGKLRAIHVAAAPFSPSLFLPFTLIGPCRAFPFHPQGTLAFKCQEPVVGVGLHASGL